MTIKVVDKIPKARRPRHDLKGFLKEFVDSGVRCAEIMWGDIDYKNVQSAYNNIHKAAIRDFKLSVAVYKRGDKIYLERLV